MENISNMKTNIADVCNIERAKRGKVYHAGCVYVRISGGSDNVSILEKDGEIPVSCAVFVPNKNKIKPEYLYAAFLYYYPEFLAKHRDGINIKFSELKKMEIKVEPLPKQEEMCRILRRFNVLMDLSKCTEKCAKNVKKYFQDVMFL